MRRREEQRDHNMHTLSIVSRPPYTRCTVVHPQGFQLDTAFFLGSTFFHVLRRTLKTKRTYDQPFDMLLPEYRCPL